MLRRRVSTACNYGVIALLCAAGIVCLLPAIIMIGGVFLHQGHPSFADFRAAFSDGERLILLLSNSLIVTGVALTVAMVFGVPIGFLTFRTDLPFRRAFIVGALLAACLPLYTVAACWMAVFGQRFWLYRPVGAGWIMGGAYTPLVMLITGVCFAAVDPVLEEQACLDADRGTVFRQVTLPLGAWGVAAAGLVVIVFAMSLITVTDILMVRTFAEEALTQWSLSQEPWRSTAISFPVIALLSVLMIAMAALLRRHGEATAWGAGARPMAFPLGRARWPALAWVSMVFAAFFLLPLAFLLRTLGSFHIFASSYRAASPELWTSVRLSAMSASVCIVLALPAAWALLRQDRSGDRRYRTRSAGCQAGNVSLRRWVLSRLRAVRFLMAAALVLLIATPAPVVGVGIAAILNRGRLLGAIYDSQLVLVLAYVIRVLPFAVLVLLPSVRQLPREHEESASLDGCNWLQKMMHLTVPLSWRGILAAWLLTFVLSLAEIGTSFIVAPPGRTTLTIRFFTVIHYGLYAEQAGMCLMLLLVVILPAALLAVLLWRSLRERFC